MTPALLATPGTAAPKRAAPVPHTLFLSNEDVGAVADWRAAVATMASAYARPVRDDAVPPRGMARGENGWMRSLTAIVPGGYAGCKLIVAARNPRQASYLISLFDPVTAGLAALIDGNQVTALRTAATSAVAVDALAPRRPLRVAVLGSGFEARNHLQALLTVRSVLSVAVYSPNPASRAAFVELFGTVYQQKVADAPSAQDAVAGADLVVCAARANGEEPILKAEWLAPGSTVVSIGSTLPEQRELDVGVMRIAARIVADMRDEVLHDTGDGIAARAAGIALEDRTISLAELLATGGDGRSAPDDIVVYKSVGSALQDVALAGMLFERARAAGRGIRLAASIVPVAK